MQAATDFVDFVPDRDQLARTPARPAPAGPPAWVMLLAIAGALGLSLSMALPTPTSVSHGGVTGWPTPADDTDTPARPGEIFHLPAWHDEAAGR